MTRSSQKKSVTWKGLGKSGRTDIKIILDAAPPVTKGSITDFQARAEALGIWKTRNGTGPLRNEDFFAVFPRQMSGRERGADVTSFVLENTTGGFLEDLFGESELNPDVVSAIRTEVDIREREFDLGGGVKRVFYAYTAEEGTEERIRGVLKHKTLGERLAQGGGQKRLFRVLDTWCGMSTAAEHEMNGDRDRRTTAPVPVSHFRARYPLSVASHLGLEAGWQRATAVVVIGSLRPGQRLSPLAATPVYLDELPGGECQIKPKPMTVPMIYPGTIAKAFVGEERENFEILDMGLPVAPTWGTFWPRFQAGLIDWISNAYGVEEEDLDEISVRTPDGELTLSAWIERDTSGEIVSSSLFSLSRLGRVKPSRVTGSASILGHPAVPLERLEETIMTSVRARCHICHSDTEFPLDPFQSKAAVNIAALDELGHDRWVQSVNGPPGTGKTSMMKSVISDSILRKVRKGEPARMLVCGPTHQASNNLLEAITFPWGKATLPNGAVHPLAIRWLPIGAQIGAQTATRENLAKGREGGVGPAILQFVGRATKLGPNLRSQEIEGTKDILAWSTDLDDFVELFLDKAALEAATGDALRFAREAFQDLRPALLPPGAHLDSISLKDVATILRSMLDLSSASIARADAVGERIRAAAATLRREVVQLGERGYVGLSLDHFLAASRGDAPVPRLEHMIKPHDDLVAGLEELRRIALDETFFENSVLAKIPAKLLDEVTAQDLSDIPSLVDRILDTRQRYECFLITFRLSEIEALRAAAAYHDAVAGQNGAAFIQKVFRDALAFALPVRAMTTHSVGGKAHPHFHELADLAIIDEAGQMGPEFVPGIAAEAHRVLAVGDPFQIPPILNQTPLLRRISDLAELPEAIGKLAQVWTHEEYGDQGPGKLPCKGANALSIIEAHAPWRGRHAPVLQGHYRCPKSIISISNRVTYQPRNIALIPHIPDPAVAAGDLPVIGGLIHEAEPQGTTENWFEADMVARWTVARLPDILALARTGSGPVDISRDIHLLNKAIAFISPFRNQAEKSFAAGSRKDLIASKLELPAPCVFHGLLPNLVRLRLVQAYPHLSEKIDKVIGKKGEGIVFGTIHALQGAECPIVVMSCVSNQESGFFDRDSALTNVGVSRSKRSSLLLIIASSGRSLPTRHRPASWRRKSGAILSCGRNALLSWRRRARLIPFRLRWALPL